MKNHVLSFGLVYLILILCFSNTAADGPETVGSGVPPSTNPAGRAIFPAKGQNTEQQMKDQLAAYNWATQQTGWDPQKAYDQLVQQGYVAQDKAAQAQGKGVKGAAGGALAGLAIGSLSGEAGKGAAIGAIGGGVVGGARSRRAKREAESEQQQAIEAFKRKFSEWDRNYVAAMEGKGYTVK